MTSPLVCIDDDVYVIWDERKHRPSGTAMSQTAAVEAYGDIAVQFADAERLAEPELYNCAGADGKMLSRTELVATLM